MRLNTLFNLKVIRAPSGGAPLCAKQAQLPRWFQHNSDDFCAPALTPRTAILERCAVVEAQYSRVLRRKGGTPSVPANLKPVQRMNLRLPDGATPAQYPLNPERHTFLRPAATIRHAQAITSF
jgi:hypothetical protein